MEKLIEIKNLTVVYDAKPAIKNINLNVWKNDFLGIIGPNGGGKTTLLKAILGLQKPLSGTITFLNNGKSASSPKIGYLPQITPLDKRFPISVREVIASGLAGEKPRYRNFTLTQKAQIRELTHQMGLEPLAGRAIGELSGGQIQRVLLSRAIISKPQILILDEPNTYVDKKFESHLYELLGTINRETAIILVSHDVGALLPLVKNIACVNETLHYHQGSDISGDWLNEVCTYPVELVGHGDLPHRTLKKHDSRK
ncbi:MAG: metal ABC transporter ATP-binding protein [Tannerella sp.]|jgi:zinc transport system ATP-binding protein|nr:metal ABC transporter ATP-binding protein [Tannerella sp.]